MAHRKAKERLEVLKDPNAILPDETVDMRRTITLGGTALELTCVGPPGEPMIRLDRRVTSYRVLLSFSRLYTICTTTPSGSLI